MRFELTHPSAQWLLARQSGTVRRAQLLEIGATAKDVERWVRRRELVAVRTGVYVAHTGPLTTLQEQWAAVLALWPAALARGSALGWPDPAGIVVAVHETRRVQAPPGVVVVRSRGLDDVVSWQAAPPRVLPEHAVLAVASVRLRRGDVSGAFAALARARSEGKVSPGRLDSALRSSVRLHGRPMLTAMVADLRDGTHSVLERGYLQRVVRPHGLPRGRRQAGSRSTGRRTFQDVRYDDLGVVVELDGWHFHRHTRDADADRDLAELAVTGALTIRLTDRQVYGDACRTAARLAQVFARRGWDGMPQRCPGCAR